MGFLSRNCRVAHRQPCPRPPCRRSSAGRGAGAHTRRRPWKRPGMARSGPQRDWRCIRVEIPSQRRAEPRVAGPRGTRRRPPSPLLGLAKIRTVGARGCGCGEGISRGWGTGASAAGCEAGAAGEGQQRRSAAQRFSGRKWERDRCGALCVFDCSDRILPVHLRNLNSLVGDESTSHIWHWDHKLHLNFLSWY
jgi:hypothetical protein